MMSEEEHLELAERLGLAGEDVMILEIDHTDESKMHFVLVEGERIIHAAFAWGPTTGAIVYLRCLVEREGELRLVSDVAALDVSGEFMLINPR